MGAQGLLMKYSRSDETQADAVGAIILHKAATTRSPWSISSRRWAQSGRGASRAVQLSSESGQSAGGDQEAGRDLARHELRRGSATFDQAHAHALQLKTYSQQEIQAGAKSGQWATLNKQAGAGLYSPARTRSRLARRRHQARCRSRVFNRARR
jgi:Zn-dependent protease with chaperone function